MLVEPPSGIVWSASVELRIFARRRVTTAKALNVSEGYVRAIWRANARLLALLSGGATRS